MVGFHLGVSNLTRNPITPNPTDPAWEPFDLTPATVDGGSLPPKLEIGGSVDGFEHENPIFNRSNWKIHWNLLFSADLRVRWSDFVRFVEIRQDLAWSLWDLAWSLWDPPRSLQDLIRSNRNQQISAKSGDDSHIPALTETRTETDDI